MIVKIIRVIPIYSCIIYCKTIRHNILCIRQLFTVSFGIFRLYQNIFETFQHLSNLLKYSNL